MTGKVPILPVYQLNKGVAHRPAPRCCTSSGAIVAKETHLYVMQRRYASVLVHETFIFIV